MGSSGILDDYMFTSCQRSELSQRCQLSERRNELLPNPPVSEEEEEEEDKTDTCCLPSHDQVITSTLTSILYPSLSLLIHIMV